MGQTVGRIKKNYAQLRASERKVADWVLRDPAKVPEMTMAQLAAAAGVSEPTVARFAEAAGFEGFSALKLALTKEAAPAAPRRLLDVHVQPGDKLSTVPDKMISMALTALEDTRRMLDSRSYEKAVRALASARLIDIYGVGNSAAVAQDMVIKLLRIGLTCRAYPDSHLQQICASALGPGDVAVGISHSGATRDTVDALAMARAGGAVTIAITNFKGAEILRHADIALLTGDVETAFYTETMFSRISQLAIVDSLYMGVMLQDFERFSGALEGVNRMVSRKVYREEENQ